MEKILIVDDTPAVLQALSLLLEIHGYDVITTTNPEDAITYVDRLKIGLVIQDMNFSKDTTSGDEGKVLFSALRRLNPNLPIILITAWTDLEHAVELIKSGAADYIAKPWDDGKLLTTVANLLKLGTTLTQAQQVNDINSVHATSKQAAHTIGLIYKSAQMQKTVDMAIQVAQSDISVLITGANGAGKEKIAELIHTQSPLSKQPFIKVNCGALPANLIEAELFGAEAGAYTGANKTRIGRFEAANGGTLFLDEIGNLSYEGQTKLLRVIQTGEFERLGSVKTQKVNVRVISATNANLIEDISQGNFREDLYYRLNVIEISVASLAKRKEDILPLFKHFLSRRDVSIRAEKMLLAHSWPGNVRELENMCKRLSVLKPQGIIEPDDLAFLSQAAMQNSANQTTNSNPIITKVEPNKEELEDAMKRNFGVIAKVAREFGLSRQALYRRLEKFGIPF